MATTVKWNMKGKYTKSCNCAYGCPCDFWDRPDKGFCTGMLAMHIDEGRYGDTPLSGLRFAATYHWPGALHEGNGAVQPFVDERATAEQRNAILMILSGQAGGKWFEVVASVVSTVHEPLFVPIQFEMDVAGRHGRVQIPGHLETVIEPIKDIVTGGAHSIQVVLPNGMEYRRAETATTTVNRASGKIAFDLGRAHSSLADVHHTDSGLAA